MIDNPTLGTCGYIQMGRLQSNVLDMGDNWLPSVRTLSQIEYLLARTRTSLLGPVLQAQTPEELEKGAQELHAIRAKYDVLRNAYVASMISSPEERRLYDAVLPVLADYRGDSDKVIEAMRQGNRALAGQIALKSRDRFEAVIAAQDKVVEFNDAGAKAAAAA